MEPLLGPIRELGFRFRQGILSELKLRPGLPRPSSGDATMKEQGFYRLVLEQAFTPEERGEIGSLWDIGCRNWSYAPALAEMFPHAKLTGVEVYGGKRYMNLHRRMDLARANAREVAARGRAVKTIFSDFLEARSEQGFCEGKMAFTFFFPFVSADPCKAWGLPPRFANFDKLLAHACLLTGEVPLILSTHQGDWEAEIAHEIYLNMGFEVEERILEVEQFAGLWPSRYPVHVMRTRSPGAS